MSNTDLDLIIATPAFNRSELLRRLARSLQRQTDEDFRWVVIDDASTDDTLDVLAEISAWYTGNLMIMRNKVNLGKSASLNRAFASRAATSYAVVDSDDYLFPDAVETIKSKVAEYYPQDGVGALMFDYELPSGTVIRQNGLSSDLILTRTQYSDWHGKWDGCIVYLDRAVAHSRYPEFQGENYIGPTVLQMAMKPPGIAFVPQAVGVAEYQADGLTKRGRAFRLRNPLGMMEYARLNAEQTQRPIHRVKNMIAYNAYRRLAQAKSGTPPYPSAIGRGLTGRLAILVGNALAAYWKARHASGLNRLS